MSRIHNEPALCNFCQVELEDLNYRFCSTDCQWFYYLENEVSETKKEFTQQEAMRQYLAEENTKIAELDIENHPENYKILEQKIALFESIIFEAKTRAVPYTRKKRELDVKDWENKGRITKLADPRSSEFHKKKEKKASDLTKLETQVEKWISLGYDDGDIIQMFPEPKFSKGEVWRAIEKMRGDKKEEG